MLGYVKIFVNINVKLFYNKKLNQTDVIFLIISMTFHVRLGFFYSKPKTLEEAVDTVIAWALDHLGVENQLRSRWKN